VFCTSKWGNSAADPRNDKADSRQALEMKPLCTVCRDKTASILDICDAFRSYLKPRLSFSQAGRAYYFTNPLLPSSLAKSKPDEELETALRVLRSNMDRNRTQPGSWRKPVSS
jgi:hypothetical protein